MSGVVEVIRDPGRRAALTSYFVTTDRVTAASSLRSLLDQPVRQRVVVVRNVRPLREAYMQTMESATPLTFIMDDDIVLEPNALRWMLWGFRWRCLFDPHLFNVRCLTRDQLVDRIEPHGIKLYRTALLRRIGWPDSSHLAHAQRKAAEAAGYVTWKLKRVIGTHLQGSPQDAYKRLLWAKVRSLEGTTDPLRPPAFFYQRWLTSRDVTYLCACLGLLDGALVGVREGSKDETFAGPHGELVTGLDVDVTSVERVLHEQPSFLGSVRA